MENPKKIVNQFFLKKVFIYLGLLADLYDVQLFHFTLYLTLTHTCITGISPSNINILYNSHPHNDVVN